MTWTRPPILRKGERIRYEGEVWTVIRVSPAAAYLAKGDWIDKDGRVLPREWSKVYAISPYSFVERVK